MDACTHALKQAYVCIYHVHTSFANKGPPLAHFYLLGNTEGELAMHRPNHPHHACAEAKKASYKSELRRAGVLGDGLGAL
jgi:hypothetical protein